jgi:hypothetical protein
MKAYTCGLLSLGALALVMPARAQNLGPQLQDASISGRGNVITVRRMPVRTPSGIVYRDITIELKLDASGAVEADAHGRNGLGPGGTAGPARATATIAHDVTIGQVTETATAPEVAAPFIAGTYRDDAHGGMVRIFSEKNRVFEGFPTWSLASIYGDTVISSAEWYAGPLRTNPHRGMARNAGISDDAYSYGVVDSSGPGHFDQGMLIGAVQKGSTLTIVSFHRRGCCTYSTTPTSAVTYTLVHR